MMEAPVAATIAHMGTFLDVFLNATRDEQLDLIEKLTESRANALWTQICEYLHGDDNLDDVNGLSVHRRRLIFRHLVELQDEFGEAHSRTIVGYRFSISQDILQQIEDEGIACDWPPLDEPKVDIPSDVIERLLEKASPDEYVGADQDAEMSELLTVEALANIRMERQLHLHETEAQKEARGRAADDEARLANKNAAMMLEPLLMSSPEQRQHIMNSRSTPELRKLLSAASRCIEFFDAKKEPANTPALKAIHSRIWLAIVARPDFKTVTPSGVTSNGCTSTVDADDHAEAPEGVS